MIAKDSSSVTSDLTHCEEDLSMTSAELVTLSEQVVKESISVRKKPTVKEPSAVILPVKSYLVDKQTAPDSYEDADMVCQKFLTITQSKSGASCDI
ncbi:unnamed protein product [Rhizophagus irregularis]|nr:unnamed protein product [Rhizophagus irregularis]CAB5187493.1 unnamed protein product [Rhizophagus irregularis]